MRSSVAALALALSLESFVQELAGQAPAAPGAVVRAYVQTPRRSPLLPAAAPELVTGIFVAMDSGHLTLVRAGGDTAVYRRETIRRLDLRGEAYHPIRQRAVIGAVLGALAGALIGAKTEVLERCEGDVCLASGNAYTRGEVMDTLNALGTGIGIGGVAGGALGALLGVMTQVYRWSPLGATTVQLSLGPSGRVVGGGVGIGMRIPLR